MRAQLVILTLIAVAAPATSASASVRSCGQIARIGEKGTEIVSVSASHVRCAVARRVLLRHTAGRTTRGWACHSAGSEARCTSGRRTASYLPAADRGCGSIAFTPNSDDGAGSIRAFRATCRTARLVARASRPYGPGHAATYVARGFRCTARSIDSPLPIALYTCHRRRATIAFQRS